ncbi:MAG: hypothetical protein ACK4VO_13100 [Pseudobdellovibrio sp.]
MNFDHLIEILKLILAWPFISLIIFSIFVFNFKSSIANWFSGLRIQYGNATLTSQAFVQENTKISEPPDTPENLALPSTEHTTVNSDVKLWRAAAYIWEYRYLNYFLQFRTQQVLDWLYDCKEAVPVPVATSFWTNIIPSANERDSIVGALTKHYLISIEGEKITITPKGIEYVEFRGKFAPVSLV